MHTNTAHEAIHGLIYNLSTCIFCFLSMEGKINHYNRNYIRFSKELNTASLDSNFKPTNKFFFTRLQYNSGDWNTDQRMPSNLLNSLVEYTTIPVDTNEKVVPLGDDALFASPFCYLSGHKLVEFDREERTNFKQYVENGGFVFVDDCNHDIDGLFAKSFETEMAQIFGENALKKIPNNHQIYHSFFEFEDGPPTTSVELNGWGDDLVHDYLKAIEIDGKIAVLYSNKDYGCEWDYDHRNKRWMARDNTRFGINIILHALTN